MDPVRSEWERQVEHHIRMKFPQLELVTNDRSIIPSRNTNQNLEIDIFIPSLRLGIELNGEQYHNHLEYIKDEEYGTQRSDEMYKEKYCEGKGIMLMNLWGSSSADDVFYAIDREIINRLSNPSIQPYAITGKIATRSINVASRIGKGIAYIVQIAIGIAIVLFWMFTCIAVFNLFFKPDYVLDPTSQDITIVVVMCIISTALIPVYRFIDRL